MRKVYSSKRDVGNRCSETIVAEFVSDGSSLLGTRVSDGDSEWLSGLQLGTKSPVASSLCRGWGWELELFCSACRSLAGCGGRWKKKTRERNLAGAST